MKFFFSGLSNESKSYLFGFIGILIFSITPTATKMALGVNNNQLTAEFITFGRSALAGTLSLLYLLLLKKKKPKLKYLLNFSVIAFCLSIAFPLCLSFGLIYSTSIHAAVILGFLPLATAIFASFYFKQKASLGFWVCAITGCLLIVTYILLHSESGLNNLELSYPDILFCITVIAAAIGYNFGAKLTKFMISADVISWSLALALPLHLVFAVYYFPKNEINIISWFGFLYVGIFSQWIGFFAWYKALDLGGTVKVSQIQLLMPFLTFTFSIILLGEKLDFLTIVFSVAIILLIYTSRRMNVIKK